MISLADVLNIHKMLIDHFGGSHGIRDEHLLLSALNRPFTTFEQKDLYPDPVDKAAALLESIVTNHPFIDGNKRTGYVLARLLILSYGLDIVATQQDKYDMVIQVSIGKWEFKLIKEWFSSRCK